MKRLLVALFGGALGSLFLSTLQVEAREAPDRPSVDRAMSRERADKPAREKVDRPAARERADKPTREKADRPAMKERTDRPVTARGNFENKKAEKQIADKSVVKESGGRPAGVKAKEKDFNDHDKSVVLRDFVKTGPLGAFLGFFRSNTTVSNERELQQIKEFNKNKSVGH